MSSHHHHHYRCHELKMTAYLMDDDDVSPLAIQVTQFGPILISVFVDTACVLNHI